MEILEIPEERRSIIEPPAGVLATGEAYVEITVAKNIMRPKIVLKNVTSSKVNSPVAPIVEASTVTLLLLIILP